MAWQACARSRVYCLRIFRFSCPKTEVSLDVYGVSVRGGADHERDRLADEEEFLLRAGGLGAGRRPPGVASGCSGRLGVEVCGERVPELDAGGLVGQAGGGVCRWHCRRWIGQALILALNKNSWRAFV